MSARSLAVVALAMGLALAVAAALSLRQGRRDARRLRRAVRTQGVVETVEYNASQQVLPTVRFTTDEGQDVAASPHSTSNLRRFQAGQPVGLRYDPQEPRWIAVDGLPSGSAVDAVVGVVLGFAAVVLLGAAALLAVRA